MKPIARLLGDGQRLHLQHGPSDLVILAEGERQRAFDAAIARFETIIAELVEELPDLRSEMSPAPMRPNGTVALRMHEAALPFATYGYLTRMAAVAGAIADEILAAMTANAELTRAAVNNGGDIALHLTRDTEFSAAICGHDGERLGIVKIRQDDPVRGVATSGRHGRSLSMGIADSVTALAGSAAMADVAATLVANAVDLPAHSGIIRRPACEIVDDSDLGTLPVVTGCAALSRNDRQTALRNGMDRVALFQEQGLVAGAALFLQDQSAMTNNQLFVPDRYKKSLKRME